MTENFDESRHSEHEDPMDGRVVDVDFSAMDEPQDVPIRTIQVDAAVDGLRTLAHYQLGEECDRLEAARAFEKIGRRVVALWWTVNPQYFDGAPSLATLAKRLKMDDSGLSRLTAELTRAFGVHNRAQAHGDGRRGK